MFDFSLPGSDPNAPNSFVQTPQQVAAQLAASHQLSQEGSSYAPVQSGWQGASRLAQALTGAIGTYRANQAQQLGVANATADFGNAMGADPGNLTIPATPGQTTPALQLSDQRNDAISDGQGWAGNPWAAAYNTPGGFFGLPKMPNAPSSDAGG